ncbi:MAG: proline--tRNA ligase [Pseudomonadales bacterium]|nr:proline--tRNA ligase [Pseudomonadales bacterium]
MKYSQLFGKTSKTKIGGSDLISHQYLTRGGFIAESVAGRYFFLPLGWRVHEKIKAIIAEEMNAAGAQEMITPVLHPLELWQETNRTNTTGFELMQVTDRRGGKFALGGTAEEMMVDVVRKFQHTYKDLPFNIYQFSTKFRDEARARGGLLRVREFTMKDAYSFHPNEENFKLEYQKMSEVYHRIFERLGLKTLKVEADNGYIGGEYCHEFQVVHPKGEGRFFVSEDNKYVSHEDIATFQLKPINPEETPAKIEFIEQPKWVKTMEDNQKNYQKPAQFFLKNVVYRSEQGDIIIVTIRGDLEVNKIKLERVLNLVGQLEEATVEDLTAIGTQPGYVHSWGHKFVTPRKAASENRDCRVIYVADYSLKTVTNFIGGQKEETTDSINVNYGRDFTHEIEADVALAQDGFLSPDGSSVLREERGIEVGNIFQLGYHYSNLMKNATFIDSDGKAKPYYMGCYGIGLGRTMATIVEKHHDDAGIIWPKTIAPFAVHLISLNGAEEVAQEVYDYLINNNVEVLWDDRSESAGRKFADADLLGMPNRLVVSPRNERRVEYKARQSQESVVLSKEEALEKIVYG